MPQMTPPEAREIVARIAAELAAPGFPRGDLAALRRMDPDAPGRTPVLLRLLARHASDRLEYGARRAQALGAGGARHGADGPRASSS